MDIYQLRSLVAVAREGNLTRAAQSLHASQPAVSAHIKALEEELGVMLFERGPKGMRLSPAGERLLPRAADILAAHQDMRELAQQLRGEVAGRMTVGTVSDPGLLRLGEFLSTVAGRHPGLEVRLRHSSSGEVLRGIADRSLDAGYVLGRDLDPALIGHTLRPIAIHIAAPAAWRERVEHATLDKLMSLPWIATTPLSFCGQLAAGMFGQFGVKPAASVEVDNDTTARSLVAAGVGLALMHEKNALAAAAAGEAVLWPGAPYEANLMFVHRRDRMHEPLLAALIAVVAGLWELQIAVT